MSAAKYALASTTDEEDAPPTSYRDDPTENNANGASENGNCAREPYRDDPDGSSIFDWGSSNNIGDVAMKKMPEEKAKKMKVCTTSATAPKRNSVSFAPLSVDDDETDEDMHQHFHPARIHHSDRLHVGGGWGRHGSTKNICYPLYRMCLCSRLALLLLGCGLILFSFGYLGYEAGQPDIDNANVTKGEEWMEWMEHPKQNMHWPHFANKPSKNNGVTFQPQSQMQLLSTSQMIFKVCNEHSLSTVEGRASCLSSCGGRLCCFEKDSAYGSCVDDPYSYCFAYAACENVLEDFGMNNVVNVEANNGGRLNEQDKSLLGHACDKENIKSLEGIRDCNALCMHHLCCFNGEGCQEQVSGGVCEDYGACKSLVGSGAGSGSGGNEGGAIDNNSPGVGPTSSNSANGHDFNYHDPDLIRSSVASACSFDPLSDDTSWVSDCHVLCADHLCCFGTPGTTSDCREERDTLCSAYSGCSVLVHSSEDVNHEEIKAKYTAHRPEMDGFDGSTIPDDIREVNEACNRNVLYDATMRSRCEKACDSRSCCFMNGPGNCYILVSLLYYCVSFVYSYSVLFSANWYVVSDFSLISGYCMVRRISGVPSIVRVGWIRGSLSFCESGSLILRRQIHAARELSFQVDNSRCQRAKMRTTLLSTIFICSYNVSELLKAKQKSVFLFAVILSWTPIVASRRER